MKKFQSVLVLCVFVIASIACGLFGGGSTGGAGGGAGGSDTGHDTAFPLPKSVSNFTKSDDGSVNFQTQMSIKDTISFYRAAFAKQGLTERTINTSITDTTFSMVFDGDPSGKAIVIQGVDLGGGKTNVNIRYDKV